jgi:Zn-dependent peptidase ImmA (M78 family)
MPKVNHETLTWARTTAGFSEEAAVKKLGIKATKSMSALERLAALEAGHVQPSRPLLLKIAQQYRRPLLAFYLSNRPLDGDPVEDFRNVPDRDVSSDALIDALVRDVKARQAMVRELLVEEEEKAPLSFVGSMKLSDGAEAIAGSIRTVLRFDINEFRSSSAPETAFTYIRQCAEAAGLFVLLIGNLGSHHTSIDPDAFRGFALADNVAPFVVINDQDARTAWSFTLFHELAHIWLGSSGISGGRTSNKKIETLCNEVAGSLLLSSNELKLVIFDPDADLTGMARSIWDFASARHLSASMVAYRLSLNGVITNQQWIALASLFASQWRAGRKAEKENRKDGAGPSYYIVRRHRLGRALMSVVTRAVEDGSLTPTKAGQVLGVKPRSVSTLLSSSAANGGDRAA